MTEPKMPHKAKKDLQTILRTMQACGEFSNMKFVKSPWYKRLWSTARMRYYRIRMKRMLARET